MSKDKVAVTFVKSWRGYSAGEVACFDGEAADDLVKGKVAEPVKAGKVTAKPVAASAGKAGGKGGAAKPDAADGAPPPETGTGTLTVDTPPAVEDLDDDELKP